MLAFACAFTMFAGAASFTDEADIQALDAVNMLTTLGVIQGYEDNSFQPDGVVTRAEMAKMIFVVRNNTADDKAYANVSTSLTDISGHWAEGYIKFCESQGIIAGKGNGIFDPDATVTGTEAAKMLLVLTGYEADKAGLEGTAWATNTLKHAGAAGILNGVSSALESGLPRQWAAQMIYNTLSASRVIWSNDSQSFDNVLNGGVKETVGRAYMGLYTSVGTLVGIDLDEIKLAQNATDKQQSDPIDSVWDGSTLVGTYEDTFTKVTTDYSDLLGQKVKVMFKDAKGYQVLGVFATQENAVYTVAANQTSKSDDKVSFDGNSYRLDNDGRITTYIDGGDAIWTTLAQLDSNALNPNMYTFIDSDGNGRLDTLVVKTYNVAKVSYAASDKIIASNQTYKYADENIADGIAKDDWVVITRNLFTDKWDIVKADVQTGTLNKLNDDNTNKDVYFDGGSTNKANYNIYTIDDAAFNGGEYTTGKAAVQSVRSENDLNAVKAGESVDYVAVNGIMFSVKKSSGEFTGKIDNVGVIVAIDGTDVSNRVKLRLFDGSTKTVYVDDDNANTVKYSKMNLGDVYEYAGSGDTYSFYTLKDGVANDKYEGYYGDMTYRGAKTVGGTNCTIADMFGSTASFDKLKIDDNAEIILFSSTTSNSSVRITGKQFKTLNLNDIDGKGNGLEAGAAAYGFSGDMSGLTRIGALALEVEAGTDLGTIKAKTWSNYGFIMSDATWIVRNKTMQYDLWTPEGLVTVQEDHNTLMDRKARTAVGIDDMDPLTGSANAAALVMRASTTPTYEVSGVEVLSAANGGLVLTAITDVSNDGKTVKFANGTELDIGSATVLYVDSDGKAGIMEGSVKDAIKDSNGKYLANALYIPVGGDADLLIVDQLTYLKSDVHEADLDTTGGVIYGDDADMGAGEQTGSTDYVDYEMTRTSTGKLNINLTADVPSYVPSTATIGVSVDVYANGAFAETKSANIPADKGSLRVQSSNTYEADDEIELTITSIKPSDVNVEYKDASGADITSKLVASGNDAYTKTLATSGNNTIQFKVNTTDATGTDLKYAITGLAANVDEKSVTDNNAAKQSETNVYANGTEAVVVTITGWEKLVETKSVTVATGWGDASKTIADVNGGADLTDKGATVEISAPASKVDFTETSKNVEVEITVGNAATNALEFTLSTNDKIVVKKGATTGSEIITFTDSAELSITSVKELAAPTIVKVELTDTNGDPVTAYAATDKIVVTFSEAMNTSKKTIAELASITGTGTFGTTASWNDDGTVLTLPIATTPLVKGDVIKIGGQSPDNLESDATGMKAVSKSYTVGEAGTPLVEKTA